MWREGPPHRDTVVLTVRCHTKTRARCDRMARKLGVRMEGRGQKGEFFERLLLMGLQQIEGKTRDQIAERMGADANSWGGVWFRGGFAPEPEGLDEPEKDAKPKAEDRRSGTRKGKKARKVEGAAPKRSKGRKQARKPRAKKAAKRKAAAGAAA